MRCSKLLSGAVTMLSALPTRVLRRLGRYRLDRLPHCKPVRVACPGGVVSFTFDDFPRSALIAGGAILEKHGIRGTYYTALDLAGTEGVLGRMFDPEDVVAAHRRGHEIACHTFRHVNCRRARVDAILHDIALNTAACAALLEGFTPVSFAYPYGELSVGSKRALAPRFWSCRGIVQGFNAGATDLAELRATRIHAAGFDAGAMRDLIQRNRAAGGWLIFYTHDVTEAPSPYGCTPAQFATVVTLATGCGAVLPVREAIGLICPSPSAPQ
jgi:peptidoglycan/xylan/chitin deacetylase (PgdA/CDA1 family)